MLSSKSIVIIAGEESGDQHAAHLARNLLDKYPDIKLSGIGGRHMQAAGVELVADLAQYGVTGFTEVFTHFRLIHRAFKAIKEHLRLNKPDLLILVDYPGFNLRLAAFAKRQLGIKILYYISPQIWAWKAKRIHLIKECVDEMAVILPFEKALYQQAGVPVSFVGHPLVDKTKPSADSSQLRARLGLPVERKVIALLPGSRHNEIARLLPVMLEAAALMLAAQPDLHFVLPLAATIKPEQIHCYLQPKPLPLTLVNQQAVDCCAAADFVIVASGTASLEAALLAKPMCLIYKASVLTYLAAVKLIKVKYLGLANLLMNKMVVPELLQYDCNPQELASLVLRLMNHPREEAWMIEELWQLRRNLSSASADASLLELVEKQLMLSDFAART